MTTAEMIDCLNAVYTQIRKDQKREEYDDLLVMADEIVYLLRNELGCDPYTHGEIREGAFTF